MSSQHLDHFLGCFSCHKLQGVFILPWNLFYRSVLVLMSYCSKLLVTHCV